MPPQSEDENSDSNPEFKINNEYAKNYNQWRQKEELHKLKQRYGEEACNLDNLSDNSSSDTSEDDDEVEVSEKFENDFFKVLAYLKSEDPKIHDEKISFFNNTKEDLEEGKENRKKKAKKEKAVTLRDFERKIILERGGKYSDSEDESKPKEQHGNRLTYVQEQNEIKNSFKAAVEDDEEDENLLVVKEKTEEQIRKEEKRKKWLKGQEVDVDPQDEVLKPIRDFWANPNLDAGEKFLRDYILDKKYQDKNSSDFDNDYDHILHDSDENLSEDEQNIERQEEFEYKYNFRFEEPDQDFIKRYPRTLENSMRKKDTRRSEKRAELKKRKDDEKLRKKEELKELKALKRKEIEEKLEKLKEITGNEDFGIKMEDLEGDFDPNEYDQKMKKMFDDDFYTVAEDDMKPQFPEIDEEINDFDNYGENFEEEGDYHDEGPNCEDENFIMDADYDPTADAKTKKVDSKKKKKGRNKNIELPKEKPKFDPEVHSSYQEYIDRYYALDYEDMIGDIPCRFKLRKSIPNNYGLTIEEILLADDKELNKWCSLKKALEFKSEETEKNEIFKFQQKAKNEALKKKILKSVYSPEEENEEQEATIPTEQTKKKRRKKKKGKATENVSNLPEPSTSADKQNKLQTTKPVSTKSEKRKHSDVFTEKTEDNTAPKKIKQNQNKSSETPDVINNQVEKLTSKKKKKAAQQEISNNSKSETIVESETKEIVNNTQVQNKKKKMKNKNKTLNSSVQSEVSEADSNETAKQTENVKKKKKEKNQNNISVSEVKEEITDNNNEDNKSEKYKKIMRKKENRKRKLEKKQKYLKLKNKLEKKESIENPLNELSADRLRAFGTNPKKFKNRLKYGNKNTIS